MRSHGTAVNLGTRARATNALSDVEDDASETILINPDLLVVGNLSQFAKSHQHQAQTWAQRRGSTNLTSAKLEGRSTTIAPPKRGVLTNSGIFEEYVETALSCRVCSRLSQSPSCREYLVDQAPEAILKQVEGKKREVTRERVSSYFSRAKLWKNEVGRRRL